MTLQKNFRPSRVAVFSYVFFVIIVLFDVLLRIKPVLMAWFKPFLTKAGSWFKFQPTFKPAPN